MKFKMPSKNRAFDNDDLDDAFGQDDLLAGDQGAPPEDEFGADELLKGDQAGNPGADGSFILNEEDEIDNDADEEDKKFLAEISKP